jgi:two-component system, OmpR family, phosphate regulon sensor histidine kinase PhoR
MRFLNPQSIRWRIAFPQLGLFLLILLGLLVYLSGFLRGIYLETLETRLKAECRLLAMETLKLEQTATSPAALEDYARETGGSLGLRFTIIDIDGAVLADSEVDPATMENHLTRPEVQQALSQGAGSNTRKSATTGIHTLYVAVPIHSETKITGIVRLAVPLVKVDAVVGRVQTTLSIALGTAALFSLVFSFLAVRRTTQPLEELTEAARSVASGMLHTTLLPASSDEIGQLTNAFNTMTAQLRSQFETLRGEREKLSAVLSQMTDGVAILDDQGMVTMLNPAAEQIFGIREEQALGRSVAEVFRHHQLFDLWQGCRDSGKPNSVTVEIGLERTYLQAISTPLGESLRGSTLLLFQNLTRLRRLETVRQDFVANISHELRTPLASLQALSETLQDGALEDPAAGRRFLGLMQTEIDTINQIIRELLELSMIESGKVPLSLQPVESPLLWNQAVVRMRLQAERGGLHLENHSPENLPRVAADPPRIVQVMMNLLHNAIKFTPPGGMITVFAESREKEVEFSIRDTGVGISAEDLPRIFERFFKADRSRSGGGTGLGLAIARHIVEAHGGRIWAESTEGKGSTFFFTLPVST